jgi:hypothetical protein
MPVIGGVDRITYRADHSYEMYCDARNGPLQLTGEWRLDRDRVIMRYNAGEIAMTIKEIRPDTLLVREGRAPIDSTFTRVK